MRRYLMLMQTFSDIYVNSEMWILSDMLWKQNRTSSLNGPVHERRSPSHQMLMCFVSCWLLIGYSSCDTAHNHFKFSS